MTNSQIAQWWMFFGLITCIIGTYRHLKGITDEPSELIVLSWFFFPFIYLPLIGWKILKKHLKQIKK